MLVSLSSFCLQKERHGLSRKKIWTYEGPSIEKKNRKKKIYGNMKVHEKKRKKRDSHALKRIYIGREIIQKEFSIPYITIHTRAHLDLIV